MMNQAFEELSDRQLIICALAAILDRVMHTDVFDDNENENDKEIVREMVERLPIKYMFTQTTDEQ